MGENASRYQSAPVRADVYWRRRVVALAIGLAVFGLVGWAVNGTLSTPAASQADAAQAGGSGAGTVGGGPAGGSPAGQAATAGSRSAGTAATIRAAGPASHAAGRTRVTGQARQRAGQGQPQQGQPQQGQPQQGQPQQGQPQQGQPQQGQPAACPQRDVVLSLHQRQSSYGGRAWPEFDVDVVSTAAQPCTFNTGPRYLSVVVRSGRRPLWNSAACTGGSGSTTAVLTRGVPAVLRFWWDRKASPPGCHGHARAVKPGAFAATAVSGHLISNSLIFALQAPRVAVP